MSRLHRRSSGSQAHETCERFHAVWRREFRQHILNETAPNRGLQVLLAKSEKHLDGMLLKFVAKSCPPQFVPLFGLSLARSA